MKKIDMDKLAEWYNREEINNDIKNHKKICEQCKYIASVPDISSPDYENWKSVESSGCEILNIIADQDVTDLIDKCSQEHKCKYCEAMTTQPDEECYMLSDMNDKTSVRTTIDSEGNVIKEGDMIIFDEGDYIPEEVYYDEYDKDWQVCSYHATFSLTQLKHFVKVE